MKKYTVLLVITLIIFTFYSAPVYSQGVNSITCYNQGVSYYIKGKYSLSIQNYKKAIALNPKFFDAYYNLAICYNAWGKTDLAIQTYKKLLSLNPKYSKAKYNLIATYNKLGYDCLNKSKYDLAITYFKNTLNLNPKLDDVCNNLAIAYQNTNQPELALQYYKKAVSINPKNINAKHNLLASLYNSSKTLIDKGENVQAIENFNKIISMDSGYANAYSAVALAYINIGDYDLAIKNLQIALSLNPEDNIAKNNLKVANEKKKEKELTYRINNVKPNCYAPLKLHNLVRLEPGLREDTLPKTHEILDLLWGDPEGRKLLTVIINKNIPINITNALIRAHAQIQVSRTTRTFTYGGIPVFSYNEQIDKNISVNIGENHVQNFRDSNLSSYERIYALHTFIHEFCHAAKNAISKTNDNALSEELSASMIGYNIASRIINNRDLSQEEAYDDSKRCLISLLTDDHRTLPIYNDFNLEIQKIDVYPPYLYLYQNIVELYKVIRDDPQTQKLDSLERML